VRYPCGTPQEVLELVNFTKLRSMTAQVTALSIDDDRRPGTRRTEIETDPDEDGHSMAL
jgi:hypothetical protein